MGKRRHYLYILLWVILLIGFCLTRVVNLMELPKGYHIDEAGMAYDAWCLSQYGVDRYLKSWPVYLTNFGTGQNALYTFLCAGLFRIFGWHDFLIRVPSVFFSLLNLIFGIKIAQKIYTKESYLPFAVGGLLVICPCFILMGRMGLESYLMLGMSTVFLYFFMDALESGKYRNYFFAGAMGGLVLYTYAPSYIILPLFLVLSLLYCVRMGKGSWKKWGAMAVSMGILAAPLIAVQIVNIFDLPEMKWGIFTITKLGFYRIGELERFDPKYLLRALNSIFVGDPLPYNSIPGIPNLYGKTFALFILGLICVIAKIFLSVKKCRWHLISFIFFWFFSVLLFGSHIAECNVNKINGIYFSVVLIAIEGIWVLWKVRSWIPKGGCCLLAFIYCWGFIRFGQYYYGGTYTLDNQNMPYFDITVKEGITYIDEDPLLSRRVTYMAENGIYFAMSTLISPYELRIWEQGNYQYGNFVWSSLGEIYPDCNYLIRHIYMDEEYRDKYFDAGFKEIDFGDYSLFYKD